MRAGINADRRRDRRLLSAQPRPLHHPRAPRDQICADRRRAGRRRRPRATEAEIAAGLPAEQPPLSARARPATCRRSCFPTRPRRRRSSTRSRGGTSFVDAARAAGFSAADITLRRPEARAVRRPRPAPRWPRRLCRRPGRGRRPGPRRRSASTSSGSSGSTRRRRGRSKRSAPTSPARSSSASAATALAALIERGRGADRRRRELRGGRRAPSRPHPRHHAADHRHRPAVPGQRLGGRRPSCSRCCAAAFEIDPDDPEPVVERCPTSRFALIGRRARRAGRAAAARPDPRRRSATAFIQQRALERARADRRAIVARINGGMPAAQRLRRRRSARLPRARAGRPAAARHQPRPASRCRRRCSTLFSMPQGRAQRVGGAQQCRLVRRPPRQRTPGDAASQPQLIASDPAPSSPARRRTEIAQQFARASSSQRRRAQRGGDPPHPRTARRRCRAIVLRYRFARLSRYSG